jgi:RHS repeat-associated protein
MLTKFLKTTILACSYLLTCCVFGQGNQTQFNLYSPISSGQYNAQKEIVLSPGAEGIVPSTSNIELQINKNIPFPVNYNTSQSTSGVVTSGTNYTLDKNKAVGSLPFNMNVSANGAVIGGFPITLPPGTNGMHPSISLGYNNLSGSNNMGLGWFISGISSISRVSKTIYHNGINKAVQLDQTDALAIDGNRLISINCPSVSSTIEYCYTTESNLDYKITGYGGSSIGTNLSTNTAQTTNAPVAAAMAVGDLVDWFLVENKDGIKMEFGHTVDSKFILDGKAETYEWKLNKVYDQYGNYMTYEYYNTPGECLIKEIKYTGNSAAGIAPYNSVRFYYDVDVNTNILYVAGAKNYVKSILREIEVAAEGNNVGTYQMEYASYLGKSYLSKVNFKAFDGSSFNPILLDYNQDDYSATTTQYTAAPKLNTYDYSYPNEVKTRYVDFSGDGIKDIVMIRGTRLGYEPPPNVISYPYAGQIIYEKVLLFKCNGVNNYSLTSQYTIPQEFCGSGNEGSGDFPEYEDAFAENYLNFYDINNDGKEDMIVRNTDCANDNYFFLLSDGSQFLNSINNTVHSTLTLSNPINLTELGGGGFGGIRMNPFWFIDMNGDGSLDLVTSDVITASAASSFTTFKVNVYLNTNDPNQIYNPTPISTNFNSTGTLRDITIHDYDNDGRMDLLYKDGGTATNPNFKMISIQKNASNNWYLSIVLPSIVPPVYTMQRLFAVDYYEGRTFTFNQPSYLPKDQITKLRGDFNGDGFMDYLVGDKYNGEGKVTANPIAYGLYLYINNGNNQYTKIYINKATAQYGDPLTFTLATIVYPFNNAFYTPGSLYYTADMNNDGFTDIIENQINIDGKVAAAFIYFSKGVNTQNADLFLKIPIPMSGTFHDAGSFAIIDFDGDGLKDFGSTLTTSNFMLNAKSIGYLFTKLKIGLKSRSLEKVINGFGAVTKFEYEPWIQNNASAAIANEVYPLKPFNSNKLVAKRIQSSNGIGGFDDVTYKYEGGVINLEGLGFLGFKKVIKSDVTSGFKNTNEYSFTYTDPNNANKKYYRAFLDRSVTQQIASSNLISENKWTYSQIMTSSSDKRFKAIVTKKEFFDHRRGIDFNTVQLNTFNATTGNLLSSKYTIGNSLEMSQTDYSNFVSNGTWYASRPGTIAETKTRINEAPIVATTNNVYTAQGAILSTQINPADPKSTKTTYTYHPTVGVMTALSSQAPNNTALPSSTYTYAYDPKFRLVETTINPLNQTSSTFYDFRFGLPRLAINITGQTNSIVYDGFGRQIKAIDILGNKTEVAYQWTDQTSNALNTAAPFNIDAFMLYNIKSISQDGNYQITNYDLLGRSLKTRTLGFSSSAYLPPASVAFGPTGPTKDNGLETINLYNAKGELFKTAGPYYVEESSTLAPVVSEFKYNDFGENIEDKTFSTNIAPIINTHVYNFAGGLAIVTDALADGTTRESKMDASDKLVSRTDPGGTITYSYYSHDQAKAIKVNNVQSNYMEYDNFARQTKLQDRNTGTLLYTYNAYGQIAASTDANGNTYNITYDALGRTTVANSPEGTYTYQYVTSGNGLNQVEKIIAPNGYSTKYFYDQFDRPYKFEEYINGQTFMGENTFDNLGRINTIKYPGGFTIRHEYSTSGDLIKIKNHLTNTDIWKATDKNSLGQYTKESLGVDLNKVKNFDDFGKHISFTSTSNSTGTVSNGIFQYNNVTGNMTSRGNDFFPEYFTYDNLDRLTKVTGTTPDVLMDLTYNTNGNILSKTGIGNYTYNTTKVDAIQAITNTAGYVRSDTQSVLYTSFNKARFLKEGNRQYTIHYGADQQRRMSILQKGSLTKTRYYVGNYERTVIGNRVLEVNYVMAPTGLVALFVTDSLNTVKTSDTYLTDLDHLGSIQNVYDIQGNLLYNLSFDAWGRRRDPNSGAYTSYAALALPEWLYRGYTGHEHLDSLQLIDMNGRIYDPLLGLFLSPDPYNQDAANTQNYNRYSYVLNNPLKYTDPSGYVHSIGQDDFQDPTGYEADAMEDFGDNSWEAIAGDKEKKKKRDEEAEKSEGGSWQIWKDGHLYHNGFCKDCDLKDKKEPERKTDEEREQEAKVYDQTSAFIKEQIDIQTQSDDGLVAQKFVDGTGQMMNTAGVAYGATELGLQKVRQTDGAAKAIGKALGVGTQQTAKALKGTLNTVSKAGKVAGAVGFGVQVLSTGYKYVNGQKVSKAENVSLGVSTVLVGAAYFAVGTAAAPFVAGAALVYGAVSLGSYLFTGNTLEENIFGKE